jgi:lipopolysaccharide biosynthesis glycosyltransferase
MASGSSKAAGLGADPVRLAYCIDERFVDYAAVSLASLLSHVSGEVEVNIVVDDVRPESQAKLEQIGRNFKTRLRIHQIDGKLFGGWSVAPHITRSTYLRILLPELIQGDRVLYLDADTVIMGDVGPLFRMQLQREAFVAGVVDDGGARTSRLPRAAEDPYFNAGVLLMDLGALRDQAFTERCLRIYRENETDIVWGDQCVINKALEGHKHALDPQWNRQVFAHVVAKADWRRITPAENTRILHFVGPVKPWMDWCNPVIAEFWRGFARAYGLPVKPVPLTDIAHARLLTGSLDKWGMYEEASQVKENIILSLLKASPNGRTP